MRPTIAVSPSTGVRSASIQNGTRTTTARRSASGIAREGFTGRSCAARLGVGAPRPPRRRLREPRRAARARVAHVDEARPDARARGRGPPPRPRGRAPGRRPAAGAPASAAQPVRRHEEEHGQRRQPVARVAVRRHVQEDVEGEEGRAAGDGAARAAATASPATKSAEHGQVGQRARPRSRRRRRGARHGRRRPRARGARSAGRARPRTRASRRAASRRSTTAGARGSPRSPSARA